MTRCCAVLLAIVNCTLSAAPLSVPFFRQQKNGCGAASVAMIVHYWHGSAPAVQSAPSPQSIYQELYQPELRGIPLVEMRRYLEQLGFRAFTFRGQWADLEKHIAKARPLIVALKKKASGRTHFAVVIAAGDDSVWLNDPTRRSAARISRSEFTRQWDLADRWLLLATPAAGS
jgi:ABC-type bacteriocin/lantibiotic exporter with double-glycine peptidase domain